MARGSFVVMLVLLVFGGVEKCGLCLEVHLFVMLV